MDMSAMPKVFTDPQSWYSSTIDSLKFTNPASFDNLSAPSLVYTYDHFSGFCALVSFHELEALKRSPGFVSASKDRSLTLHTTHTPEFLFLNAYTGLWPASKYGEDVIVAVIDSGVWPERASFKDKGLPKTLPTKWKGICQQGETFNSSICNAKLIGARYYNKGLTSRNPNINISMNSARDTRGHGTYTSSIVAGNYVNGAKYFSYGYGVAKGVAPRARLAIYKVSWDEGMYASDALAAMNQAISDGVDVISMSMAQSKGVPLHRDVLARASFAAMEKGVLVSTSAGNRGDSGSNMIRNGYPWVLTTTAGTIDRWYAGTLALGNGLAITGWTIYLGSPLGLLPLVYDEGRLMCNRIMTNVPYGILICHGYLPLRLQIKNIVDSNALGAILIANNSMSSEIELITDTPCACLLISSSDAVALLDYIESTPRPLAAMQFLQTIVGIKPAPSVAANALRGPSRFPGILKPDVMAPGSFVLGAWPPIIKTNKGHNNKGLYSRYNLLSGTSVACPHTTGIAALLKGVHPEWSPAAIKSAIMTTADPFDNTRSPIKDNADDSIASPLAMGAGQIHPNHALDPGFIYDASPQDYVNLLCSMNYTVEEILSLSTSKNYSCSSPSYDFNYPAFLLSYGSRTSIVQTFQRTVTNVGKGAATYKATMTPPRGSTVKVSPPILMFTKKYEKQSYQVSISYEKRRGKEEVAFGALVWVEENGNRTVRSPIVIVPKSH